MTATQRVRSRQHRLDGGGGQLEGLAVGLGEAHLDARAGGGDEPRRDVGVVVQARADDLVAGLQRPARPRRRSAWSARSSTGRRRRPPALAPSSRATEARASATSASVRSAAWKAPPWLAVWPERIQAAISSMASSTICVPAAPSRRAQPSARPGKRVRCMGADRLVACRAMPQAAVDGISLYYERRGAGEPVLLIQGMSGDAPGVGRRVPGRPGRRPRRRRLRPPRRRDVDAGDRRRSPSRSWPTTPRALLDALELGARPRGRHLDGRHGRPGARAAPPAADPHADPRLHVPRRRGRRSWPTRP